MLWKVYKIAESFKKMHTTESRLPMEKFSILRRNSIAKVTTYMPKIVTRSKTKSQGFREASPHLTSIAIGNSLGGVSCSGATQIHFCYTGVKTNGEVYQAILNNVLPRMEETVFVDEDE